MSSILSEDQHQHFMVDKVTVVRVANTLREKPIGECIYCGSKDELSEEHVIPLSLGGLYVLPEASCGRCSRITSKFERSLARGFMYDARIVAGLPTRRPKQRPKHIEIKARRGTQWEKIKVPIKDATAILQLPLFKPPALLDQRVRTSGVDVIGHEAIGFGSDLVQFHRITGADEIQTTVDWDLTSYARLIAKIAYGFAVGKNGVMPRHEIPILPLILGETDDAGVWLGSMNFTLETERDSIHAVATQWTGDPEREGRNMFVARVKLFANSGATGMGVVVWRPDKPNPKAQEGTILARANV